ncbi:Glycoside hydrolase family 1 [Dillenia turbinata]|uniref:Glycoside hydrolase family 1 n=1 Tax=Dillenia turbinata TaxID=194707 RepID=A0AAN8VPJ6_9MAGN
MNLQAASSWLHVYPKGIREVLLYTKTKYKNPLIYITENGVDEANNSSLPLKEALKDPMRIYYYHSHLLNVKSAIEIRC